MNASQIWKILRTADLKPAKGSLFYGKGALVKRSETGWKVIPCSASLLDPYRLLDEARDAIRVALTTNKITFQEQPDGFYLG